MACTWLPCSCDCAASRFQSAQSLGGVLRGSRGGLEGVFRGRGTRYLFEQMDGTVVLLHRVEQIGLAQLGSRV
eukprot:1181608-Prorocentrum_minimum.AAC.2